MNRPALALAIAAVTTVATVAQADTDATEASTTLPQITVFPSPAALLIDRLSRQIIAEIGSEARLLELPQQEARAEQADVNAKVPPKSSTRGA